MHAPFRMTPARLLAEARAALEELKVGRHWITYRAARPSGELDVDELLARIEHFQANDAEPVTQVSADEIFRAAARQRELVSDFAFSRGGRR